VTRTDYITCRELIDFIAEYLDGSLPSVSRAEFERHLAVCESCVAYLDGYRKAMALGKKTLLPTGEAAGVRVPEGLIKAIRAARLKHNR
jgi:anti-sigma factor RsiW